MLLPHVHLTQGHHVYSICPNIIFQILLPCSRSMMSHHVTCHVTAMSHASSSLIKKKEIQKKRNIKSRKIDKRKRKMLVSKAFHNMLALLSNLNSSKGIFISASRPSSSPTSYYLLILLL